MKSPTTVKDQGKGGGTNMSQDTRVKSIKKTIQRRIVDIEA